MEPFIGQLMLAPYNFAPTGWAFCAGQLMPIARNTALFSLLGTQYGGDGKSTFGLPNLTGAVPVGAGQAPGLSSYVNGETGGVSSVTLTTSEVPPHNHSINVVVSGRFQLTNNPQGAILAAAGANFYAPPASLTQSLSQQALTPESGQSLPHNNLMPYQVLNWFIALQGVYPSRG